MKDSRNRQNFFGLIVIGLLLAMAIPATALGQGRGRGHGRGNVGTIGWPTRTRSSNYDKKCAKFRNCHDASEGRWDGRGRRGNRASNIFGVRARHRNRDVQNNFLRNRGRRVGRRAIY